ncbi:hypothetical protein [Microbaculum sp. FT89]|uniref:hypothetical protein n=1 Tax=Microbaculum sp. FT89 TaxID=3447298 RepID=UPI003F5381CC
MREIIDHFRGMIRTKTVANLDPWIDTANSGLDASFAHGIARTAPPSAPQSPNPGRTARPKARSTSARSSIGRFSAVPRSICSKHDWLARIDVGGTIRNTAKPKLRAD